MQFQTQVCSEEKGLNRDKSENGGKERRFIADERENMYSFPAETRRKPSHAKRMEGEGKEGDAMHAKCDEKEEEKGDTRHAKCNEGKREDATHAKCDEEEGEKGEGDAKHAKSNEEEGEEKEDATHAR